jgi:mycothiol system anti-sigma-R factor
MGECEPICEETLKELERFLDGELTQEIRVEIEHHLSDCHPCTRKAEFRRHVKVIIATKCTEHEVPAELRERIRAVIRTTDVDLL